MADVIAEPPAVVATSIFSSLQSRMSAVHRSTTMGAFAGPPGIGKTTAVQSFERAHPRQIACPLLRREGATATSILQAMLAAVRRVMNSKEHHAPSAAWRVENMLETALKRWWDHAEHTRDFEDPPTRLSLVFDEAQTLTPKMIEMLRYWNDGSPGGVPGLGIVFVGNDQFRLDASDDGPSFLSAAVASRTGRNRKTWTYDDVTDDDVRRIAEARGVEDTAALDALVDHARRSSANRDLRQFNRTLSLAFQLAGEAPVTGDLINRLFPS